MRLRFRKERRAQNRREAAAAKIRLVWIRTEIRKGETEVRKWVRES